MARKTPQENFSNFLIYSIPLIVLSKVIRWTILFRVLVAPSIGHKMVLNINQDVVKPFQAALFTDASTGGTGIAFDNAVALFNAINVFRLNTYIQWEVFFTIIFNVLIILLVRRFYMTTPNIDWKKNTLIYMGFAILNIFCLNMAKEPYQLVFFLLLSVGIIYLKGYNNKSIWVMIVLVLMMTYARKYYVLILIFFVAAQVLVAKLFIGINAHTKAGRKLLIAHVIYTFLILAVFHFFLYQFISGANEDAYDQLVAVNNRDQNRLSVASSEIVPLFGSNNQLFVTLEFFAKIFRLSFPIELLVKGKITYIFVIAFQLLLFIAVANAFTQKVAVKTSKHGALATDEDFEEDDIEEEEKTAEDEMEEDCEQEVVEAEDLDEDSEETEEDEEKEKVFVETQDRRDTRTVALYFYIAFLLCSACFEPDYGSWSRHLGVVFPVLLFIL